MCRDIVCSCRDDDLARLQDRELVGQCLHAVGAGVFGRGELAGGEIEKGDADRRHRSAEASRSIRSRYITSRAVDGYRHQEGRLARVEIAGIGQRSGRHDPDDLAFDDTLGLPRVLDLIADRDAESLLHQAGDVAVDGAKRHAAHRNTAAAGVLGARRQRQLERARRGQRVLVEHLVEVAHPEEQDRVAVLLLGVEILPHRRRRRR